MVGNVKPIGWEIKEGTDGMLRISWLAYTFKLISAKKFNIDDSLTL